MSKEEKYIRFQRIAQERKGHILECIQALGCCADPASYAYEAEALPPIFQDIAEKLAEVWHRLNSHSPYPFISFRLNPGTKVEIGLHCCRLPDMAPMDEVLDLIRTGGSNFTALEPIRNRYAEQFGNELCWSYPFCFDNYPGCIILLVREGVLCLPYTTLDSETYERIDAGAVSLLTAETAKELMNSLLTQAGALYLALADICRALPSANESSHSAKEVN